MFVPGPFASAILADLGADVIKVEPPGSGDQTRGSMGFKMKGADSLGFLNMNRNKRSVTLNLKSQAGREILLRLAKDADILIENYRPGAMKRLGLGFDELREAKEDIVLLSLSASGQTGPDTHFAGYAPLFGAWGGLGWMSGYTDGPPVEMRHVMDHSAGMHAALATMAALHQRRRTGLAQHVDLAAREVASAMIGDALVLASVGQTPVRPGNAPLAQPVWSAASLDLESRSIVPFDFAALNYVDPARTRYRYRLDGLEAKWNETDSARRSDRMSRRTSPWPS